MHRILGCELLQASFHLNSREHPLPTVIAHRGASAAEQGLDPEEYAVAVAGHLERSGIAPPEDGAQFAKACSVAQEKAQTLAEVWPLIRFVFSEPVDDDKARKKFLGPEGIEVLRTAHAALEGAPEWSPEALDGLGRVADQDVSILNQVRRARGHARAEAALWGVVCVYLALAVRWFRWD